MTPITLTPETSGSIHVDSATRNNMKKVRAPRKAKKRFLKSFPRSEYYVRLDLSRECIERSAGDYTRNLHLKDKI